MTIKRQKRLGEGPRTSADKKSSHQKQEQFISSKNSSAPVEKNKEYTADVVGLTSEGMGVARIEGFTIFIAEALPGEKVRILIVAVKSHFAYGKLLQVLISSPERVEPRCHIVKRCGGCTLQHLDYEAQLKYKTQQVQDALERLGGFQGIEVLPAIGMKHPWRYRNKAQFPVGDGGQVGFYANRTHNIIPTDTCMIQDETNDAIISVLKEFIRQYGISTYDERTGQGLIRHIMSRKGFRTGEIMIVLVINGEELQCANVFVDKLQKRLPMVKSVVLNINRKNTNVILGTENKVIYGKGYIYDYIGAYLFKISPLSFFQVNPVQTEVLYQKALALAGLTGTEIVIDAYCGIGTISLFLSGKARKVYGVEIVPQAIENAKENAQLNHVENVSFTCGESEVVIPQMLESGIKADVIVVDPPRKGCGEPLLEAIAQMAPKRVVYVSCNPATLARDLKYLCNAGYQLEIVQPVDMFAMTAHVETCVLLSHKSPDSTINVKEKF